MEQSDVQREGVGSRAWGVVTHGFDSAVDWLGMNMRIIRYEADLFLGVALTIWGVFGFRSGRYCDGNTAEYLSCTRPAAFYYYDWFHIVLIFLGVTFVLLWIVKRGYAKNRD